MRVHFQAFVCCLAGLAASGFSKPRPPAGQAGEPVTSLSEIAGPWDIARFDGYTPTRLHVGLRRAFVDVGKNGLSYTIECNYSGNPAHIDASGTLQDNGGDLRTSTAMLCDPVEDARERSFYGFFHSPPKVQWLDGGRLRMWTSNTELILEAPSSVGLLISYPQMN